MQVVREYTATNQIFTEAPKARPAIVASGEELQRAFNDLMAALSPADRTAITTDLRQRAGRQPSGRQLDMSPAAVEAARRLFSF